MLSEQIQIIVLRVLSTPPQADSLFRLVPPEPATRDRHQRRRQVAVVEDLGAVGVRVMERDAAVGVEQHEARRVPVVVPEHGQEQHQAQPGPDGALGQHLPALPRVPRRQQEAHRQHGRQRQEVRPDQAEQAIGHSHQRGPPHLRPRSERPVARRGPQRLQPAHQHVEQQCRAQQLGQRAVGDRHVVERRAVENQAQPGHPAGRSAPEQRRRAHDQHRTGTEDQRLQCQHPDQALPQPDQPGHHETVEWRLKERLGRGPGPLQQPDAALDEGLHVPAAAQVQAQARPRRQFPQIQQPQAHRGREQRQAVQRGGPTR